MGIGIGMSSDLTEFDAARAQHQVDLLGKALGEVLVAAGMIRADAAMTGPQLLLAAEDFCRAPNTEFHEIALRAYPPVPRDDGRFYVPVVRDPPALNESSPIVLRVASDAFLGEGEAERFAEAVTVAWNHFYRKPY